jgi:hypothetical protein
MSPSLSATRAASPPAIGIDQSARFLSPPRLARNAIDFPSGVKAIAPRFASPVGLLFT